MSMSWLERPEIQVHLRSMMASSSEALGLSQQGIHVFMNPAYLALFGYASEEELVGTPILKLIAPAEHPRITEHIRRRSAGESVPAAYETRGRRKDGTEFPMEVRAARYLVDDQPFTNVMLRDLTERHAAARAVAEAEEKFHVVAEHAMAGVVIMQDGRVVYANPGSALLMGRTVEEILQWSDVDFVSQVHPEDLASVREQSRHSGINHPGFTYRLLAHDGKTTWVEQYSRTVLYRGRPAYLVTTLDVDARKRAEQQQAELQNALRQAQKMEAIGRLAGGVAHDFNNLLTGILGNVELAMAELSPEHGARVLIEDASRAAVQAANLTRELLAFSRKQAIQPRVVDLNELVSRMERMVGRLLSSEIVRTVRLHPTALPVMVDPSQMEQVIVNLVLNARDAMPAGGELRVWTSEVELSPEQVVLRPGLSARRYARLSIADGGSGLADDVKEHLFEPFFTTKERGRGTGLGLATSFGAVRQNDGTIEVDSQPGRGTTFHVYLPLSQQMPAAVAAPVAARTVRGSETILLVEDEPAVLRLTERVLSRQGYRVVACASGKAALAAADAHDGEINLLLTDVVMPGMNGQELAHLLVAARKDLRVMFMSGYAEDVLARRGVVPEHTHFITKPFTPAALTAKVREVLDQGLRPGA